MGKQRQSKNEVETGMVASYLFISICRRFIMNRQVLLLRVRRGSWWS